MTDTAACEWCGDDYALDESPCVHLMLCATCSADCRQCRTEPIEDDDARRELRLDEQGRWGG